MADKKETFEIEGKVKNIVVKDNNHLVFLEDGTMLSAFGSVPKGLEKGKTYSFEYKVNGDFKNYDNKKFKEVSEDGPQPEVKEETVQDRVATEEIKEHSPVKINSDETISKATSTKTPESMGKVELYQKRTITNSEGQAFGLSCNLSLRKTLQEASNEDFKKSDEDFWVIYGQNVKRFYSENQKLRQEMLE